MEKGASVNPRLEKNRWFGHKHYLLAEIRPGGGNVMDEVSNADPEILKVAESMAPAAMLEGLSPGWAAECRRMALCAGLYTLAGHDEAGCGGIERPGGGAPGVESLVSGQRNFVVVASDPETALKVLSLRRSVSGARGALRRRYSIQLGELFGYPSCCVDFFSRFDDEVDDLLFLKRSFQATKEHARSHFGATVFTRSVFGLNPVLSHIPCRLDCAATLRNSSRLAEKCAAKLGIPVGRLQACLDHRLVIWDDKHFFKMTARGELIFSPSQDPGFLQLSARIRELLQETDCPGDTLAEWVASIPLENRPVMIQNEEKLSRPISAGECESVGEASSMVTTTKHGEAVRGGERKNRTIAAVQFRDEDTGFAPDVFLSRTAARIRWRGHHVVFHRVRVPRKSGFEGRNFSEFRFGLGKWIDEVSNVSRGADVVVFDRWVPREIVECVAPARTICLLNHPSGKKSGASLQIPSADIGSVISFLEEDAVPAKKQGVCISDPFFPVDNPFTGRDRRETILCGRLCSRKPPCFFCADVFYIPEPGETFDDPVDKCVCEIQRIRKETPRVNEILFYAADFVSWCGSLVDAAGHDINGLDLLFQARVDDLLKNWSDVERAAERAASRGARLHAYLVGLENFSDPELQRLGKNISSSMVREAAEKLVDLETRCSGFVSTRYGSHGFILFNPWTTVEDLEENLSISGETELAELRREYPLTKLRLYPGTVLTDKARKEGLLMDITPDGEWDAFLRGYAPHFPYRFQNGVVQKVYDRLSRTKVTGREDEALREVLRSVHARSGSGHTGQKAKKVLLVQPPRRFHEPAGTRGALPSGYPGVGILSIAAYLEQKNFDVTLLHLGDEALDPKERAELLARALDERTALVGVSMNWVHTALGALETADFIRTRSDVPIVLGGQHASLFSREIARSYGSLFNVVVRGPAETALVRLLEQERSRLEAKRGEIVQGEFPEDPDLYPLYGYSALNPPNPNSQNNSLGALSTVRGHCPRNCSYCLEARSFCDAAHGNLRAHSTDWLVEAVKRFVSEGRNIITIQDPFFILGDEPLIAFVEALHSAGVRLRELNLFTEPGAYSSSAWDVLAAGPFDLVTVDLGVESGSTDRLRDSGRMYTPEDVLDDIDALVSRDLLPYTWWMVGLPWDTWDDVEKTSRFLRSTMEAGAAPRWITPMILFPQTPAFKNAPSSGVIPLKRYFEDYLVFSTTTHSRTAHYPGLITHETPGLNSGRILAACYALKRNAARDWGLLTERHASSRRWGKRLDRLGSMLRDETVGAGGFAMDTFF